MERIKIEINAEELERRVLDTLYSRRKCLDAGINYNNPRKEDFDKARKYLLDNYYILNLNEQGGTNGEEKNGEEQQR